MRKRSRQQWRFSAAKQHLAGVRFKVTFDWDFAPATCTSMRWMRL
jgi:hypothetical protein